MATNKRCIMECTDADGEPRMATPRTDLCGVCGNNISGWLRRRIAERIHYRGILALRARRMEMAVDYVEEAITKKKATVVDIRPHLKRAKAARAKRSA